MRILLHALALALLLALSPLPASAAAELALPAAADLGRPFHQPDNAFHAVDPNLSPAGADAKARHLRGYWSGCGGHDGIVGSDTISYHTDGAEAVTPEEVIAAVAKRFGYGEPKAGEPDAKSGDRRWSWVAPDQSLNLRLIEWKAGRLLSLQLNQPYTAKPR